MKNISKILPFLFIVLGSIGGVYYYNNYMSPSIDYDGIKWLSLDKINISDVKVDGIEMDKEMTSNQDYLVKISCKITNNGEPLLPTKQGELSDLSFSPIFHLKDINRIENNNKEIKSLSFDLQKEGKKISFSNENPFMTGETVIGLGQFRFTEEEFKKYFLDESFIYTPELYIDIMGYKSSEYNDVTESDKPFLRVIKQDNYNTQLREEVKKVHNKNTKGK